MQINQLSYAYQDKQVLDNLTYDFNCSHTVGLLGRNGSGKTTLLRILNGLLPVKKGMLRVNDHPLSYSRKSLRAHHLRFAMVFQDPQQQLFYATVEDDIAFALKNIKLPETEITRRVEWVLDVLQIRDLRKAPIQSLSFGQKKRVAIAGVLVMQTDYLLLDEPTAGLDPQGRRAMIETINKVSDQGVKLVISSHDMDFVYEICQQFLVLDKGKIVLQGNRQQVFQQAEQLEDVGLEQPWTVRVQQAFHKPESINEMEARNLLTTQALTKK